PLRRGGRRPMDPADPARGAVVTSRLGARRRVPPRSDSGFMGLSRRVPVSNVASTHRIPERFPRPACGYTAQVASPKAATAAPLVPSRPTLKRLRQAAAGCRACELWRQGTQTVFGEGSPSAAVMLVGEQPGDRED